MVVARQVLHLTPLRPQLFATLPWTDPVRPEARRLAPAGAQIDQRLGVLRRYERVLSAGNAIDHTGSRRAGDRWMQSLKVK